MKYHVNTDVFGGCRIIQELSFVDDNNQVTRLSRWILDTKEEAVHQALLKLGWMPPNLGNATGARCICPLCNQQHDPKLISGDGPMTDGHR